MPIYLSTFLNRIHLVHLHLVTMEINSLISLISEQDRRSWAASSEGKDWHGWVMWPEWTRIEEPNKWWTGLRDEKGEEEDWEKIGQRPSAKICEDWNWCGKMLSTQRRTGMVGGNASPDVLSSTGRT